MEKSMQGKTVVVTGATSGIGEVAAIRLSEQGARIVMIARSEARAGATLGKLAGSGHAVHFADLSRLREMKRVAGDIAAAEPKIDVLMNNAGALFNARQVTEDGLELTFATNHMSYFVVTNLLLDRLKSTPGARIVSTSSAAHKRAKLDFDDLQAERDYSGFRVYGKSKLANILFTRELARRLEGSGVTANCLHPGFVATRFGEGNGGVARVALQVAQRVFAISSEDGAKTMTHLASSPELTAVSGRYFYKCKEAAPSAEAQDDVAAERLWAVSAALSGVGI
ncbi:MAG TPA: SDR family oxidoreductase [Gammaproteobacteria bacterium]|nr:SDR family oxidoreductase [Gammaproteobacteria bacterium]